MGLPYGLSHATLGCNYHSPLVIRGTKNTPTSLTKLGQDIVAATQRFQNVVDRERQWLHHQITVKQPSLADSNHPMTLTELGSQVVAAMRSTAADAVP